ncbi:zinc ribbon domain-containing protein [Arthrobacter sp. FX8]|uniref:zinc ribbon domain-containing protein n=1 Tax=Arthrobacter sp. FX8 TaxID=2997335 RepID=UPI00227B8438|nr:zinc ribbon domain-containing protein [Arthrobacter sp. FX8]WAJ34039.1 zinc ribbon domain-containing protein [Arthrobacter sp. FX8]
MTFDPERCPRCRQPVPAGATFCTACGAPLPNRAARRPHPGPVGGPSKERSRGSAPRALVGDSRYYPGSRKAPGTAGGHRASGHLAYGYRAGQDGRYHKGGGRSRGRNGNGSEPSACSGCGGQAAWRCRH